MDTLIADAVHNMRTLLLFVFFVGLVLLMYCTKAIQAITSMTRSEYLYLRPGVPSRLVTIEGFSGVAQRNSI